MHQMPIFNDAHKIFTQKQIESDMGLDTVTENDLDVNLLLTAKISSESHTGEIPNVIFFPRSKLHNCTCQRRTAN